MASYLSSSTKERTSHLMRFYNHFSGTIKIIGDFFHNSVLTCLMCSSICSKMQQLRRTTLPSGHWSEYGKGGQDGQRYDQSNIFEKTNLVVRFFCSFTLSSLLTSAVLLIPL